MHLPGDPDEIEAVRCLDRAAAIEDGPVEPVAAAVVGRRRSPGARLPQLHRVGHGLAEIDWPPGT